MSVLIPKLANTRYFDRVSGEYYLHFCRTDEIDKVVNFIDMYWKKGHALVQSRELLDWQHFNPARNEYNFVLAEQRETAELHVILGFIQSDILSGGTGIREVWPAIWKARNDIGHTGLGMALYNFLQSNLKIETIIASGISESTLSIYRHLDFKCGKLKQWYVLNNQIQKFSLIANVLKNAYNPNHMSCLCYSLTACSKNVYLKLVENTKLEFPRYKSPQYYIRRFYEHPIYIYDAYSIAVNSLVKAVFFTRVCEVNGSRAIRIVDYIGDFTAISGCYDCFQELLKVINAEYIDFINIGFDEKSLMDAGFIDRSENDIIIPNYFEPFCQKNIDLHYAFKSTNTRVPCVIFKADGDQDRPNTLESKSI